MKKNYIISTVFTVLVSIVVGACQPAATTITPTSTIGPPSKLAFITQPGGAAAGSMLNPQPVVAIQDSDGNTVTSSMLPVKLIITTGTGPDGAVLFGPSMMNSKNGVASFSGLSIDKAGAGYTLTANSSSLAPAVSAPINISTGSPAKLAFSVQPSGGTAGSPFGTQPVVTVLDNYGTSVSSYEGSVTISITYGSGARAGVLSGNNTVRVVDGVARFTDLSIDKTHPEYTLTASGDALAPAVSQRFGIVAASPVKLEFTVHPGGAKAGEPFYEQPKVAIEDVYGNVVLPSRDPITLSITPGTGTAGAVLSGTITLISEGGIGGLAEFENLAIDKAGAGYKLTATSGSLTAATSRAFDVVP